MRPRTLISCIALSVIITLTACGSVGDENTPTPTPTPLSPVEMVLSVFPDNPENKRYLRINNFGAMAEEADVDVPGPDASYDEVVEFKLQLLLAALDGHWVMRGSDFLAGFDDNSFKDGPDLKAGIGLDTRDIALSANIYIEQNPARQIDVVYGNFNPDLTRNLLETCSECAETPDIVEYRGQTYFSWGGDGNVGAAVSRGGAQPAFDARGRGGKVFVGEEVAFRTTYTEDMEAMLDALVDSSGVLQSSDSWPLAAEHVADMELLSVAFTGDSSPRHEQFFDLLGVSRNGINNLGEDIIEMYESYDEVAAEIRASAPELPAFEVAATGIGSDNGREYVGIAVVFSDESEAEDGLAALQGRIDNGDTLGRGWSMAPWSEFVSESELSLSGRTVSGRIYLEESRDVSMFAIYRMPFLGAIVQPFSQFLLR